MSDVGIASGDCVDKLKFDLEVKALEKKVTGEEMELVWKKWRNMGQAMEAHAAISEALVALSNVDALRCVRGLGLADSVREVLAWQKDRIGTLEIREDNKTEKIGGYEGAIDEAFETLYGPLAGLAGYGKEWVPKQKAVALDGRARLAALVEMASEAVAKGERDRKYIEELGVTIGDLRRENQALREEKCKREKSALVGLVSDDTPGWARDRIEINQTFYFPFVERLRVLFGRPHRVRLRVYTEWKPGRTAGGVDRGWVDPLFRWPWCKRVSAEACAVESKEERR